MIGDRIKEMRLQKRYSITRLAEKAHISKSYLSQIEKVQIQTLPCRCFIKLLLLWAQALII